MTDYAARRTPNIFKPAIDTALVRIAHLAGTADAVAATLAAMPVPEKTGPWGYLTEALEAVSGHGLAAVLPSGWAQYFAAQRQYRDDCPSLDRIKVKRYPKEARKALEQDNFVGGYDADIVLLWVRDAGHASVCHAHPEGFWILGQDPIDFIERAALQAEGKTLERIRDPEVEALAAGR